MFGRSKVVDRLELNRVKLGHEHEYEQALSPIFSDMPMIFKHRNLHVLIFVFTFLNIFWWAPLPVDP